MGGRGGGGGGEYGGGDNRLWAAEEVTRGEIFKDS